VDEFAFDNKDHPPEEEDYVLLEFSEKKLVFPEGKILTENHSSEGDFEFSCLRRGGEARGTKFEFPTVLEYCFM
jgi:hypothetical protein